MTPITTKSSAQLPQRERAPMFHRSIVRCKRHFDMLHSLKACASVIVNV